MDEQLFLKTSNLARRSKTRCARLESPERLRNPLVWLDNTPPKHDCVLVLRQHQPIVAEDTSLDVTVIRDQRTEKIVVKRSRVRRQGPDPKGDRVKATLLGKFSRPPKVVKRRAVAKFLALASLAMFSCSEGKATSVGGPGGTGGNGMGAGGDVVGKGSGGGAGSGTGGFSAAGSGGQFEAGTPTPGIVYCVGTSDCPALSHQQQNLNTESYCCVGLRCVRNYNLAACESGTPAYCDDASDCDPGLVCCDSEVRTLFACQASCGNRRQLCRTDGECPVGKHCVLLAYFYGAPYIGYPECE